MFEYDKFATGTEAIAKISAQLDGNGVTTIITGGDSVAAVEKVGLCGQDEPRFNGRVCQQGAS